MLLEAPGTLNITTIIVASIGSIIGALLPDIDQVSNRLWDLHPAGHVIGGVFDKLFLSHRTLSHSLLGVFLVYKLLGWLLPKLLNASYVNVLVVFVAIMTGYLSH